MIEYEHSWCEISRVKNGWLVTTVRPSFNNQNCYRDDQLHVFTKIEDLARFVELYFMPPLTCKLEDFTKCQQAIPVELRTTPKSEENH